MARPRKTKSAPGQLEFGSLAAAPASPELEITALDVLFARLMLRLHGRPHPALERAAQGASAWSRTGHTCAPLARLAISPSELEGSPVVGLPGEEKPLILEAGERLYLHRYWSYEQALARTIAQRVTQPPPPVEEKLLRQDLERFLPYHQPDLAADQRHAAASALRSSFTVITGGPGTGKTRTVAVILALLARQAGARPLRCQLAAPTGKAALRLTESIRGVLAGLPDHGVPPLEAVTLHRLLGLRPNSPRPQWDAAHPLPAEVVIVDEASMVDLALMAKLCAAVPPHARLILLGDQDQLASVESGHVLGDIGAAGADSRLQPHLCALRQNFRFPAESGIHRFSTAVRAGDPESALQLLAAGAGADLTSAPLPTAQQLASHLAARVVTAYQPVLAAGSPAQALQALGRFRVLAAVREGPFGVGHLNRLTEQALAGAGLLQPTARFHRGRAIMVLRNDYGLRLFNGDIGLIWPNEANELRAWFPAEDGGIRSLPPSRLPEHETAWAMTVHKSQGSEFERILMILPDQESAVVTRELIYTGITRARTAADLWFHAATLPAAISRQVERFGGLREKLQAALRPGA